ncbi:MAG TPA: rhomboid family intramembrane serine protease [Chthonomonadaceae bacterium]|nr:rhomboid family intramembrane serine protease [Chthonomonadaceae bacterium]
MIQCRGRRRKTRAVWQYLLPATLEQKAASVIPLHDNLPTRRFPIVCILLIAANVLVFLVDQATSVTVTAVNPNGMPVGQETMGGLSLHYSMIPAYVTGQAAGNHIPLPITLQPAWLTVFTSMFLHANWLHIGGNMLYLWIFGNNIEDALGPVRFLLFYLACGIGAAGLHIASDPASTIPTIGASGAIAGVMGAYIYLYPRAQVLNLIFLGFFILFRELPAYIVIGFWIVLQVINANVLGSGGMLAHGGGVAYLAHVGGFFTGIILIVLLGGRRLTAAPPTALPGYDLGDA